MADQKQADPAIKKCLSAQALAKIVHKETKQPVLAYSELVDAKSDLTPVASLCAVWRFVLA
jgi:hypothetical protein